MFRKFLISGLIIGNLFSLFNITGAEKGETRIYLKQLGLSKNIEEQVKGVKIYTTKNEIEEMDQFKHYFNSDEEYYKRGASAIYSRKERKIYVETNNTEKVNSNIMHELAHDIDKNNISSTDKFLELFIEERYNLFSENIFTTNTQEYLNYYSDYRSEYFAETFAMMFDYRKDILEKYAPKTYEYMINNFFEGDK